MTNRDANKIAQQAPLYREAAIPRDPGSMRYVQVAPGGRYFMTEDGAPFLAIGHNEAMTWPYMRNLKDEKDVGTTEAYIKMLAEHGVTVLRIMLEYCQNQQWFFEMPVGTMLPQSVLYWDDLIGLCERYRIRLLVAFWDTYFLLRRWKSHPYGKPGTGFEGHRSMCTSAEGMEHQKRRIRFFVDRWGDSPAIFAYDLFNEITPDWGGTPEDQGRWVSEMARFVKEYEMERWGKRHLLTVSICGYRAEGGYRDLIFRHPELDFATNHVYETGMVDNPTNSVDCAIAMGDAVRYAYENMTDVRPYTDTESGPIHLFLDLKRQLPKAFENEYYHNMSWAHLVSGGAGSGMRWPFRYPHTLTEGMHKVQLGMANFIAGCGLDWVRFSPRAIDDTMRVIPCEMPETGRDYAGTQSLPVILFGCSDGEQALIWLLRDLREVKRDALLPPACLLVSGLQPGEYDVQFWETYAGVIIGTRSFTLDRLSPHCLPLPQFNSDLAITIKLR